MLIKKNKNPHIIIANTIKGKGVSFMENSVLWHYKPPNNSEVKKAIRLLNKELNIISEPGGAASVASFLKNYKNFQEKVVIIIVSGGNIDNTLFKKIINNNE